MDALTLHKILELAGVVVKKSYADKVHAICPFARWRHSGGTDAHPSFGFYRTPRGNWRYKCFGCGARGNLRGFFWHLMKLEGFPRTRAMRLAYEIKDDEEVPTAPLSTLSYGIGGKYGQTSQYSTASFSDGVSISELKRSLQVQLEEKDIQKFLDIDPPAYVFERGFSLDGYRHFGLGHDLRNKRWVFPVRGLDGQLVGMTARLYWDRPWCFRCGSILSDSRCEKCEQSFVRYKHSHGSWRRSSVFGIDKITPGHPIVITEGTTDALRLWCEGVVNPVAILGSHPSYGQLELIAGLGESVVCLGDGDQAGRQMNQELVIALSSRSVNVVGLALPDGTDPDSVGREWLLNELSCENFTISLD